MFACNAINQFVWSAGVVWVCLGCHVACSFAQEPLNATDTRKAKPVTVRYVTSSQAEVYAGPDEDFYPTTILEAGQAIEVHQETSDGWLAITPPAGSFSWLPASQGLLLPGGRVVEVTEKSAVSWIGSSLGTAKQYRWQVKLERGQQMAVLGEQTISDPASGSKALWYKIAPPTGEYRWIQSKATSDRPPVAESAEPATQSPVASSIAESDSVSNDVASSDSQVVPASAQMAARSTPGHGRARRVTRPSSQSHADRWDQWHAMEFKNGSFSFPGLARMLGMAPPPTDAKPRSNDDPFDLTANTPPVRSKDATRNYANGNSLGLADEDETGRSIEEASLAVRQSRGWRDPRQLREERLRGSMGDRIPEDSALASYGADQSMHDDVEVMDAGSVPDSEIGSSVVTAGANEPRGPRINLAKNASTWYGLDQAPASHRARAGSLAEASLDDLQLELSTMVAGPEANWNLSPLADRARYFIEHGQDSLQRGQARLLLERIQSFAQVSQSQSILPLNPGQPPLRAIPASASLPATMSAATGGANATGSSESQFDATGWLVPVHSDGRDMPTHALTNDTGRIIVYVTAAPGVNLARFESQAIGVYGLRGYLPQLKTNHIQIQKIVRLQ